MYTIHTHTHHDQKVNILNFIRFTLGSLKLILQEKFTSPTDIQLINDYYIILYNLNQEIVFCAVYACRAEDRNKAPYWEDRKSTSKAIAASSLP
jgi:hypothetical protein